jgi:dipeptidyl aminopeptidase/acylaminoacyl peptidase
MQDVRVRCRYQGTPGVSTGRAAIVHVHGGGYRQFARRGWTVYGYALHLAREHGIDSTRIGIYGVSYGGFMTLMSQFFDLHLRGVSP